jgi:cell division protein FtsZ
MSEAGTAMMGSGVSSTPGERAREAAEQAINSPLLDDIDLTGSRGILVNVTSGPSITMGEFTEVGNIVRGIAADDANVIIGMVSAPDMGDDLRVTVVATGIGAPAAAAKPPVVERDANHSFFNSRPTAAPGGGQATSQSQPNVGRAAHNLGNQAASQGDAYAQHNDQQVVTPNLRAVRKLPISSGSEALDYESEYFDAPAFLRHQND